MLPDIEKNNNGNTPIGAMTLRGDGRTISVKRVGNTCTISSMGRQGSGRSSSESVYLGPWAAVQKSDTSVTVKAIDTTNGYICKSLIIAGLTTTEHSTDSDVTISASGVVYADITQSGGTYSIAFANAAALPDQTSTHFYAPLAYVTFADGAITGLAQAHQGQIYPNRVV